MLFVTCAAHLESLLQQELIDLGIEGVEKSHHGVYIPINMENIYKVNYLSRLATRCLLPLVEFPCPNKETLYNEAKKIDWLSFMDETKTFSIDAFIQHPQIRHSLYGAQLLKDAICDVIRDAKGERPSIDTKDPDIQLNLLIREKNAIISFDTSGAALYKRGYREHLAEAAIQETLAAAILKKSGYAKGEILCDPFCGSGTFLIEAACIATNTPAGFFRKEWGFMHLPLYKKEEWEAFKKTYDEKRSSLEPGSIIGVDLNKDTLRLCKENLQKAGFDKRITLVHADIKDVKLPKSPTLIVTNPPFGKRFEATLPLYKELGLMMQRECPTTPWAYVLTAAFPFARATGCPILSEWHIRHGGLRVCLYQLENSQQAKRVSAK